MHDKEKYEIAAMLDTLTIEQKKDFLSFLQALQAQEQQHSASADTADTTTAPGTDQAEPSSQAQHDTTTTQASHSTTEDTAPSADTQNTSAHTTTTTDAAPDNLSREPRTVQEAAQRIRYMYLPDVTTQPAGLYHQAIMEYIEAAPTYSNLDLGVMMAYAAGVQHGKHIERAKRKQRASLQQ